MRWKAARCLRNVSCLPVVPSDWPIQNLPPHPRMAPYHRLCTRVTQAPSLAFTCRAPARKSRAWPDGHPKFSTPNKWHPMRHCCPCPCRTLPSLDAALGPQPCPERRATRQITCDITTCLGHPVWVASQSNTSMLLPKRRYSAMRDVPSDAGCKRLDGLITEATPILRSSRRPTAQRLSSPTPSKHFSHRSRSHSLSALCGALAHATPPPSEPRAFSAPPPSSRSTLMGRLRRLLVEPRDDRARRASPSPQELPRAPLAAPARRLPLLVSLAEELGNREPRRSNRSRGVHTRGACLRPPAPSESSR